MENSLLDQLKTLLLAKKLHVALAESLTCGHLQAALGSISGSSDFFEGGVTAYNLAHKVNLLGVDREYALSVNCVSQRIANQMAEGACRLFHSKIGIGTTGYAEISPELGILQPYAFFAICRVTDGNITRIAGGQIDGKGLNRVDMQLAVTHTTLQALLSYLLE